MASALIMVTNFFRIHLPFSEFQIQRLAYSDAKLRELRAAHNRNASFFRNGDFIYASPRRGVDDQFGELVKLEVEQAPAVVLSLLRHLIFRAFRDAFPERIPESFAPLRFFSAKPEHDAMRRFLPSDLQDQIALLRMVEVEVRQIQEGGRPSFGLLIRSRQRWKFRISLTTMRDQGFDLRGKTVIEAQPIPGLAGVLAPDETLLGQVESTTGEKASIRTNDGVVERRLDALLLQRTREQIGTYLEFRLGTERTTQILENVREWGRDWAKPSRLYSQAVLFASWFTGSEAKPRVYENADGFCFTVTRNNGFNAPSVQVQQTSLIFDHAPGASAPKPFQGLAKFGPFNAARFEKNDLRLLVLAHPGTRGAVTQFLKRLIDGIPESRYFQRGLKSLFRLNSVTPTICELQSQFPEAYEEAIDTAIANADSNAFDLALVECPEGSAEVPMRENPYYRARARLMSFGIPTQGVRDTHLRSAGSQLEWTLGPFALQIYAKVGGTPWRLPGAQSVDHEIVVGVGSALERPNLWAGAEQSRIVGITTFFLGDGRYIMGERLRSVPYEAYFEELLSALKGSLTSISEEYAWRNGETIRLVFHIFKPIKHVEADVVAKLVAEFPQFRILFAFVTISTEHPWMLFRDAAVTRDGFSITLCERGDNLVLDGHNCLLQLRGDRDRPNHAHRPPYPVAVRIHERSTYKDIKYIAQQVHDFSYLSWRSFFPGDLPVTVFYANLIAREASNLSKIPGWNPAHLEKHFRRKQWFL